MAPIPFIVKVTDHPGSSKDDIDGEPNWGAGHQHRVGFQNQQGRIAGITHRGDEHHVDEEFNREAQEQLKKLKAREKKGDLVNFRDAILGQKDYHLQRPDVHSIGWRYVIDTTEDWIKNKEPWPANLKKRQKEEEAKQKKKQEEEKREEPGQKRPQEEHEWKRDQGENKHHDAYASSDGKGDEQKPDDEEDKLKSEDDKLREKYSPQEIALLRALQHEKDYISRLDENDGKRTSPVANGEQLSSLDEADQFTPDNWIARSTNLIRLTGNHPLNGEPQLGPIFEAGLITPNHLHYVRNHGAVPHLLWETHIIDIHHGKLRLSMDDLHDTFESINIPVALACDGNRRKELNMVKRSKGFNWGSGAVSCAYWKGPLLRDVLLRAGVSADIAHGQRRWVNFEGADNPSEGKYATCIPLSYAMDPANDVILAWAMNDVPLPPDHGAPVRMIIPGYVGGRCVKWLQRIWISDKENDSHYHIWDNRVLPSFITEKDGEFANTMFAHPDTACNEQNLNSVIVKPAHGEEISLAEVKKGKQYRIQGYAYDGGGHEVQRVEVSLDDGETWLYCIRQFPDAPIRNGNKFWTWLHWHVDVQLSHLVRARGITVRCFNVFKNTQPERPIWNTMGMMNNCWYVVKPSLSDTSEHSAPRITFRHPVAPGTDDSGWMQPSTEQRLAAAKQTASTPSKQFTREEIEKHNTSSSCWLVINRSVYDATSVLSWHPGGAAAILGHAGAVHQATTDEFASIHDDYASQKLSECILGVVTDKAAAFIKENADAAATDAAKSASKRDPSIALQTHRWTAVKLEKKDRLSDDTRRYTFRLPPPATRLALPTCAHLQLGFHFADRMLIRSYTPTRPILASEEDGTFDLVVKTYFPDEEQPGGAMGNLLDCMPMGEEVEVRGPTGGIRYEGQGKFTIDGKEHEFRRVTLVVGGSGVTPAWQLVWKILRSEEGDDTQLRVIDANKSEGDILLEEDLERLAKESKGQLVLTHVLSHPSEGWEGGMKGHVDEKVLRKYAFGPGKGTAVFLCGPPGMVQKGALPALKDWGYVEEEDCFGF